MIHIIIRNPLNYEVLYEGEDKSLRSLVNKLKKEYPHNTYFTFQKLKYCLYNQGRVDFVEIKNTTPKNWNKN